jgi:adenine-specific DNA-methyltransferase
MSREEFPARREPGIGDYASTKLIAYIGNKRAILPFIASVFRELGSELGVASFLDPFAGSGSVSRLARSLGWSVAANDAEEYSRAVNDAWLGVSLDELPGLFREWGGLGPVLAGLNALHPQAGDAKPPCPAAPYIARHYAPACTAAADWRRERLFYTRENAVFLDRARYAIEYRWPAGPGGQAGEAGRAGAAERALLLGLLIYEAATHANTSGVFKAYHKGFGGHGGDALGRILSPMRLEPPLLWGGPPSEVCRGDAAAFCAARSADLCYLDPPYNQHQYGSNYHLLNTIARWDRPPVRDDREDDGSLVFAAGIPPSWKESRSAFCSKSTAGAAFRELLSSIDARAVVLSYSTEGIVSPEELVELLSDRADLTLRSLDYVKYRGGRQSASSRSSNCEILFVARRRTSAGKPDTGRPEGGEAGAEALRCLRDLKAELRLSRALAGPFAPAAFKALCGGGESLAFGGGACELRLKSYRCLVIDEGADDARSLLDAEGKAALAGLLEPLLLPDNAAACEAAAGLIEGGALDRRLQELALVWLRKLAYRSYEQGYRRLSGRLKGLVVGRELELAYLAKELGKMDELFEARLAGRSRRT